MKLQFLPNLSDNSIVIGSDDADNELTMAGVRGKIDDVFRVEHTIMTFFSNLKLECDISERISTVEPLNNELIRFVHYREVSSFGGNSVCITNI